MLCSREALSAGRDVGVVLGWHVVEGGWVLKMKLIGLEMEDWRIRLGETKKLNVSWRQVR